MTKICMVAGSAPHYRKAVFKALESRLNCDFIFSPGGVKQMDLNEFKHAKRVKDHILFNTPIRYQERGLRNSRPYDVLILNNGIYVFSEWLILLRARLIGQKTFIWAHGWYGKETRFQKIIKKLYYKLATGIMVYGERAKKCMEEEGIDGNKIVAIHNSLDYDNQVIMRQLLKPSDIYKKHFLNDSPVIIFIGRLTPVKQLDMLINAISLLKDDYHRNVNLVFVGDGPERDKLETLAKELNIQEKVWFYGACYNEKTNAELIFNADLCVAPGNVGLTAMHTMVFGTPVISHNDFKWQMPEHEAIKEGKTGAFFEKNNIVSMTHEIDKWLSVNENRRETIRHNCYDEIDTNWTPEFQVNTIVDFITRRTGFKL